MPALKYKRDFTHEQRVSFAFANSVDAAKSASSNKGKAASTPAEYKQNQCAAMGIGMGPRIHEECPYSAINHSYASTGSQALEAAITAGYKQVFGNIGISDNQRLVSLEAFLCDGRINVQGKAASTPAECKQNQCAAMGIGMGPRIHEECPYSAINHSYASTGSQALEAAITAGYKQVFGNIGISDNQRLVSLEAFLCDGRINVQGFMAGLVKSELYKNKFFHAVSPMRGIELTTKHLLGRPPINQKEVSAGIQLIAAEGFDAFVDSLVRSEEYLETFGTDTVPYLSLIHI